MFLKENYNVSFRIIVFWEDWYFFIVFKEEYVCRFVEYNEMRIFLYENIRKLYYLNLVVVIVVDIFIIWKIKEKFVFFVNFERKMGCVIMLGGKLILIFIV